jgi:F-type H+-transporting ATPase subunit gamma
MGSLQDIRRRITSVQKTQQITRAMRMVAAAKLRRAQEAIEAARPYAEAMRSTLEEVAAGVPDAEHPLLKPRESVKTLEVVIVTSDRGLCGAFNSNVIKHADALIASRTDDVEQIVVTAVGRKANEHARRRGYKLRTTHSGLGTIAYGDAIEIATALAHRYAEGEVDEVVLVYAEFVSTLTQMPRSAALLPFTHRAADGDAPEATAYEIEPSANELLAVLVPKAVEVEVYRALLENQSGEHAARMSAMESATRNTEEMIESLTLTYNRARQAAITKELVEIVSGAEAL